MIIFNPGQEIECIKDTDPFIRGERFVVQASSGDGPPVIIKNQRLYHFGSVQNHFRLVTHSIASVTSFFPGRRVVCRYAVGPFKAGEPYEVEISKAGNVLVLKYDGYEYDYLRPHGSYDPARYFSLVDGSITSAAIYENKGQTMTEAQLQLSNACKNAGLSQQAQVLNSNTGPNGHAQVLLMRNLSHGAIIEDITNNTKEIPMLKSLTQDIKKFTVEHKSTIYCVAVLLLLDHVVFNGSFRNRLQSIMTRLVDKVEKKLDDKDPS